MWLTLRRGKYMARVTIEDCLKVIDNAFDICALAGRRAKDLSGGAEPLIDCKDKPTVIALREIAQEKIGMDYFKISNKQKIESQLFGNVSEEEVIDELSHHLNPTPAVNTGEETIAEDNSDKAENIATVEKTEESNSEEESIIAGNPDDAETNATVEKTKPE
jgi:DNA-directed RNA polymerase subunit omega